MKAGAFINAQNIALWITNILMENQSIGQNRSLFKCFNLLPYYLAVPTIVLQKPTRNTMTKGIS
jgi:hypothetical protein